MKGKDIRFHHVFFTYDADYYIASISDFKKLPNVDIVSSPSYGKRYKWLYNILHTIHYSRRINRIIRLPFKSIWNKTFYNKKNDGSFYCFMFQMGWLTEDYVPLFKYLKRRYPYSCFILAFEDIISSRKVFAFDLLNEYFDFSVTFDKGDAQKYGFYYCQTTMSKVSIEEDNSIAISDFCFIGAAKNRYELICDLYKKLTETGARVDFMVSRLQEGQKKIEGIKYIPYLITYKEYLQHVSKTRCIIELLQDGGNGCTSRTIEALVYGKKLLTNNMTVKNTNLYKADQIFVFSSLDDIPTNIIINSKDIPPMEDNSFSPLIFLKTVEGIVENDYHSLLYCEQN